MNMLPKFSTLGFGEGGSAADHARFQSRWKALFEDNRHAIEGKTVLDLACNTGRMAFPCIQLGAKKVVGVEWRQELIDHGKQVFEAQGVADRMEWNQGDLFDFLAASDPGAYDTILCLGFLYHTVQQVEFFRQVRRLQPRYVIIDTSVAKNYTWLGRSALFRKPPALFLYQDDAAKTSDTSDIDGLVFWPSTSFLETMFDKIGYKWKRIDYSKATSDWSGLSDYKKGIRASYIAQRV